MQTVYYFTTNGDIHKSAVPMDVALDWERYHNGDTVHRAYGSELAASLGYMNWLSNNGDALSLWGKIIDSSAQTTSSNSSTPKLNSVKLRMKLASNPPTSLKTLDKLVGDKKSSVRKSKSATKTKSNKKAATKKSVKKTKKRA